MLSPLKVRSLIVRTTLNAVNLRESEVWFLGVYIIYDYIYGGILIGCSTYVWISSEEMLQRSRILIGAVVLDCYSSVVALRTEKLRKLGAALSTSPISRDAKSANRAVNWTLFGFLGTSSVLFYWSIKRTYSHRLANFPVIEAASESDVSRSKRFNFLAEAVEKVLASVVYIEIHQAEQAVDDKKSKKIPVLRSGSGFIVDERGLILTNAHVIAKAPYISVQLHSGDTFSATVIDVNETADLALIKLELEARHKNSKFPALKFGKSNERRLGEWVIALGSPLFLKNTVTSGIVSTVSRTSKELPMGFNKGADMEYIQTDAPMTYGNSGGPLVNLDGEVVGINTMGAYPGISFAVPSKVAEEFISSAQRISPEEKPKRYMLGVLSISPAIVMLDPLLHNIPTNALNGVLLLRVWPGSPASDAGLQVDDIIVKIDKTPITSSSQVYDMVQKGKPLSIEVVRGQQKLRINITPEPII